MELHNHGKSQRPLSALSIVNSDLHFSLNCQCSNARLKPGAPYNQLSETTEAETT